MPIMSWIRAAELYRAKRLVEAEKCYKSGLIKHPNHPAAVSAKLDLSHCLFKSRKIRESESYLRDVICRSPETREAYVRLARLKLWIGHATEAAWVIKNGLQFIPVDPELAALFSHAAADSGMGYLIREALEINSKISDIHPRLEAGKARLALLAGVETDAEEKLIELATSEGGPFEAVVPFAESLLQEGKIAEARYHLHRALSVASDHPRVLSMLARTYLFDSEIFDPGFALQLALRACQNCEWSSPFEMHVLANAYIHTGDKVSALLVASRAKEEGEKLLGVYKEQGTLNKLIEKLSSETHDKGMMV